MKTDNANQIDLSKIHDAPYNPRTITEHELKGLANSIAEFGDISGITWNETTGNLVTGHHRWHELLSKGEVKLKKITAEFYEILIDGIPSTFSFRKVKWPLEKEMAANVAANSHAISGKFEVHGLQNILLKVESELPALMEKLNFNDLKLDLYSSDDDERVEEVNKGNEKSEWNDMPEFKEAGPVPRIVFTFKNDSERESFIESKKITIEKKIGNTWTASA